VNSLLLGLLWCPDDHGDLEVEVAGDAADRVGATGPPGVRCRQCGRRYPVIDGVLSFLADASLDSTTQREQASRDAEAAWYHGIFAEYTNLVEVPATVANLGQPEGPVLDHGAGTGRVTAYLARHAGQPIVALDYSLEALRLLVEHCADAPVPILAVHADGRDLPVRDGAVAGITSAEVYEHFRPDDRRRVLHELHRVLRPGAPLSISSLNFNVTFRLWRLRGNPGAKEGDHMFGSDFFYVRQTPREFRDELAEVFDVVDLVGVRNIPARSLASIVGRVAGRRVGDRLLAWMTRRGYRLDVRLARTPISRLTGFFLLAKAVKRPSA
jgi:SAM-dependent methyltransferase